MKPQGLSAAADLIQRAYEAKMGVVVVHGTTPTYTPAHEAAIHT